MNVIFNRGEDLYNKEYFLKEMLCKLSEQLKIRKREPLYSVYGDAFRIDFYSNRDECGVVINDYNEDDDIEYSTAISFNLKEIEALIDIFKLIRNDIEYLKK